MSGLVVSAQGAAITVNGTSNGIVTLASTLGYYVGALVWLSSATQPSIQCLVESVSGATLGLRAVTKKGYGFSDVSAYLVADAARVDMESQFIMDAAPLGFDDFFSWDGTTLTAQVPVTGGGTEVPVTIATFGSAPAAGGASIVANTQVLTLQPADATHGGGVSIVAQTLAGAKRGSVSILTSTAGSIAVNLALNNNYSHTLTEVTVLAAPSNAVVGQSGIVTFTQHASSPKTLTYDTFWKFPGGTVPTLTATNGAVDLFIYYVYASGAASCQLINDVK